MCKIKTYPQLRLMNKTLKPVRKTYIKYWSIILDRLEFIFLLLLFFNIQALLFFLYNSHLNKKCQEYFKAKYFSPIIKAPWLL